MTVSPVLFSSRAADWETPQELFDRLNAEFHFTLDAAADERNHKCPVWLRPGTPREEVLTRRVSAYGPLEVGDVVSVRSGGGGGWGPPAARDPQLVLEDVREGFVSPEEARSIYRVALVRRAGSWEIDREATERMRSATGGPVR